MAMTTALFPKGRRVRASRSLMPVLALPAVAVTAGCVTPRTVERQSLVPAASLMAASSPVPCALDPEGTPDWTTDALAHGIGVGDGGDGARQTRRAGLRARLHRAAAIRSGAAQTTGPVQP